MEIHNTTHYQVYDWFAKNDLIQNANVKHVIGLVQEQTGIPVDRMLSKSKKDTIVYARNLVYFLLFIELGYSSAQIGDMMHVHPKTVVHSVSQIIDWSEAHPYVLIDLNAIKPYLNYTA